MPVDFRGRPSGYAPIDCIALKTERDVQAGDGVLTGNLFGVARAPALAGQYVSCVFRGTVIVNKEPGAEWKQGDLVVYELDERFCCVHPLPLPLGYVLIGVAAYDSLAADTRPLQVTLLPGGVATSTGAAGTGHGTMWFTGEGPPPDPPPADALPGDIWLDTLTGNIWSFS